MKKIVDFIKSILYYKKLKRYFNKNNMTDCDIWNNSIEYALWHSQILTEYPIRKLK